MQRILGKTRIVIVSSIRIPPRDNITRSLPHVIAAGTVSMLYIVKTP